MHFSMICYFLNCSSRSHVVVRIIWEEKTHVIQGKKIPANILQWQWSLEDNQRRKNKHIPHGAECWRLVPGYFCVHLHQGRGAVSSVLLDKCVIFAGTWGGGVEKQECSKCPTFSSLTPGYCYQAATPISRDRAWFPAKFLTEDVS